MDPDGILRYEYQARVAQSPSSSTQKGKGKEMQDNTSTTDGQSTSRDGMLVTTVREEKKKVFYYFKNEEGGEVKTRESDWMGSTRKVKGMVYDCFEYTGKTSGRVYYTWAIVERAKSC